MTRLQRALFQLDTDFKVLGVRWALIGGLAVGARAEPRTTRDVDVAVAVASDREAERLIFALRQRGYREAEPPILEQTAQGRLATVRLSAPTETEELASSGGVIVDLLFASSGIESELVAEGEVVELTPGFGVPVARVGHLLALKVLAARPERGQDLTDIQSLKRVADPGELQRAREALELIARRGFDREKDLQAEFARLLAGSSRE